MKNTISKSSTTSFISTMALITGLVLIAGLSRLIPHPWNFTAVGAMALFSGSRMPNKVGAFLAPLLSLLWTDAILGFHITAVYVYAAVALITIIGFVINSSGNSDANSTGSSFAKNKTLQVVMGSLAGSVLFFVITNFGVWFSQNLYPKNLTGLLECYTMAIPFFRNQVAGDLFYAGVLFGTYAMATRLIKHKGHAFN